MSLNALGNYIGTMRRYRNRHSDLFRAALTQIPNPQLQVIQQRLDKHKDLLTDPNNFVMVAIPSHLDNPKLWETFGLKGKLLDRIGPWSKINEQGVILASRKYRDDNPRGHDFFAYAAKEEREGRGTSMSDVLANRTGKHEGSHGITDALFMDLLNIDAYNPIYEGFVGALGEDDREKRQSVSFGQLLRDPYPTDTKQRMDNAYYAGAKYWTALKQILQKKGNPNPWQTLISQGLSLATNINGNQELMTEPPAVRITKYLNDLPNKMNFDLKDVETQYDSLGVNS